METEDSSSIIPSCLAGGSELSRDHLGIKCPQGHDLCPECAKNYVTNLLSDPETMIPAKCVLCKIELNPVNVEMQMTPEQLEVYLLYVAMKRVDPSEKIMNGPFCKYFEIWLRSNSSNFFYGRRSNCAKASCSVCFKNFTLPKSDSDVTKEELKEMEDTGGMFSHHKCYKYKDLKKEWDDAIDQGTKVFCPGCGIGGVKNDDCTHMTCDNGNTRYCYCCGLSEEACDKSTPGNIYKHNVDWSTNPSRCPMYLTEISQVDERYSESDDQQCRNLFHQIRIYTNIKKFIEKHGLPKYEKLTRVFPSILSQGYDIKVAMEGDMILIHRDD